jgi:hypothetical protein
VLIEMVLRVMELELRVEQKGGLCVQGSVVGVQRG